MNTVFISQMFLSFGLNLAEIYFGITVLSHDGFNKLKHVKYVQILVIIWLPHIGQLDTKASVLSRSRALPPTPRLFFLYSPSHSRSSPQLTRKSFLLNQSPPAKIGDHYEVRCCTFCAPFSSSESESNNSISRHSSQSKPGPPNYRNFLTRQAHRTFSHIQLV